MWNEQQPIACQNEEDYSLHTANRLQSCIPRENKIIFHKLSDLRSLNIVSMNSDAEHAIHCAEVNTFLREQLRKAKERLIARNHNVSRNHNAKQVSNQPQERPVVVLYDLRADQKVTCDAWTYLHSAFGHTFLHLVLVFAQNVSRLLTLGSFVRLRLNLSIMLCVNSMCSIKTVGAPWVCALTTRRAYANC